MLLLLGNCKEKYTAPVHIPASGYLVVEGFINVGNGSTDFTLTRATGLDSPVVIPEYGAVMEVQSDNGASYPLIEQGNGKYSVSLAADPGRRYRIHIRTADGKEYQSDFSSSKITPPIDSISWKPANDGVWIYVTTHDPTGNSRYYQWTYEETWEYNSAFISSLKYLGGSDFAPRPLSEQLHLCYISDVSNTISIGSSEKLREDLMFEYPLEFIPYAGSDKLRQKYSILVKQRVLTKEWYEWDQKVKKNTEQLGSIFDAQPSDITGNIHCLSDPTEPVIGYAGCSSEAQQRIFINHEELPRVYIYTGYEECVIDTVMNKEPDISAYFEGGFTIPLNALYAPTSPRPIAYTGSSNYCVDCRLRGGVLTKPDFWP
jgi:hypothetical protein